MDPDVGAIPMPREGHGGSAGTLEDCETIGDFQLTFTFPNRFRGNMFQVEEASHLIRFAMELDFNSIQPTNLTFYVLRETGIPGEFSPPSPMVDWVQEIMVAGAGLGYYWSNPFPESVVLQPGVDYVLGVSWGATPISYARDQLTYPRTFADGVVLGSVGTTLPLEWPEAFAPFGGGAYSMQVCFPPRPGACCRPASGCASELPSECLSPAGFFQGEGSDCEDLTCTYGACCRPNGTCAPSFTLGACTAIGGTWTAGAACSGVECEDLLGACCVGETCLAERTSAQCTAAGGHFRGGGTECTGLTPACGSGACCSTSQGCFDSFPQLLCGQFGGTWRGDGTTCDTIEPPCSGLCCFGANNGLCLSSATPQACTSIQQGGTFGIFLGYGVCGANVCTPENLADARACCVNDDCVNATETACAAIGGTPVSTADHCQQGGVTCEPDVVGACCHSGDSCSVGTISACQAQSGVFQGAESDCNPNPCLPRGACCTVSGDCDVIPAVDCLLVQGGYQGDESDCSPDPCAGAAQGACCLPSGACETRTELQCLNADGDYQGDDVACVPETCPTTGACCLVEGTCRVESAQGCRLIGGVFEGLGTDCSPNPCDQPPVGACCEEGGDVCNLRTASGCAAVQGAYQGDNTPCVPNPCTVEDPILVSSIPPDGAIDARQPSNIDGSNPTGWSMASLTFDGDTSGLTVSDFSVSVNPPGPAPAVSNVSSNGNLLTLSLSTFLPPGKRTTITYLPHGTTIELGYLPADVSGDGVSTVIDILRIIDAINGVIVLPIWSTDVDRSGLLNPQDVLREIDLLNGAGAFDPWIGQSLP